MGQRVSTAKCVYEIQTKNQIRYRDPDMIATWSTCSPQFKNRVFETQFHFQQIESLKLDFDVAPMWNLVARISSF